MTTPSTTDQSCFHCGLPNPPGATIEHVFDGQMRHFCCVGCEAVADTIFSAGLQDYYQRRTATGLRPGQGVIPEELAQYDHAGSTGQLSVTERADLSEADLLIDGMTCAACAWLAERTLKRLPGVQDASVQYATGRARVTWKRAETPLSGLLSAMRRIGLDARPGDKARDFAAEKRRTRRELMEWLVAGLAMMQVMMYSIPVYLSQPGDVSPEFDQLMRWASLALTTPVIVFSAQRFFINAWRDLLSRQVGMDVPVALALALTFGTSAWSTATGHGDVYFDSITMFVFLLLGARYLEQKARRRAARAMERLAPALPPLVERLSRWPAPEVEKVPGTALKPGDVIRIAAGAIVPADSEVLEGRSALDESLMSGEARPIPRAAGEPLLGGSLNVEAPLVARVVRTGDASTLAQLARLARQALSARPPEDRLAQGLAAWFSGIVLVLASLTALYWWQADPQFAFRNAVAVLVVTCPCALALALPAAWATGSGRLSHWGLLTVTPRALDALHDITDVVFDKTGTLTEPGMGVRAIEVSPRISEQDALAFAASLEAGSLHPLADALRRAAQEKGLALLPTSQLRHVPGSGIEGELAGRALRLGQSAFALNEAGETSNTAAATSTRVHLADADGWLASFEFESRLRADAIATVARLQSAGLTVHLLSGDAPAVVEHTARLANIRKVQGGAAPAMKRSYVAALQRAGHRVLMVGDGCNDAPVLAQADAAIAVSTTRDGADLARAQADLLLLSGELARVPDALALAAQARQVMRQNLWWALGYNLISVPLAMAGLIHPWVAALGMSASSLLVVSNAARLLEFKPARHTHQPAVATGWVEATPAPASPAQKS